MTSRRVGLAVALPVCLIACTTTATSPPLEVDEGPELVYFHGPEPGTIDPGLVTDTYGAYLAQNLFEGLTVWDETAQGVKPGVAESWELSPYPRVYTFHLRADARWSDGSPVIAGDFVAAWLRVLDPANQAGFATLLYVIEGAREIHTGEAADVAGFGARAADDHTLVVTLEAPAPYFLELTADAMMLPVNPECVKKHGWTWTLPGNIVVNGPFQLATWKPNDRLILERNPQYWDASSIQLSRAIALTSPPEAGLLESFRAGRLHWTGFAGDTIEVDQWPSMASDPGYREHATLHTGYVIFNARRWPFDDALVRQAFAAAIDRERVAAHGRREATERLVPAGMTSYDTPPGIPYDPERARGLLAEAGYPRGEGFPAVEISVDTQAANVSAMREVALLWTEELGVDVRVYEREWRVQYEMVREGRFDVARGAWIADYPDPINFLEIYRSDSQLNFPGYDDPIFDAFVEEAQQTADAGSHDRLLHSAEARLLEQVPIVPLYHELSRTLVAPTVRGYEDNLLDVHLLRYLSVE
jgi:oligopeptide transport system substrate-binding protein